nr:MAG TPA: hypothetical protein [Caudoviricetes sp.]
MPSTSLLYHSSSSFCNGCFFVLKIKEVQYGKSKIYPI